jgi:hypothetical protein
MVRGPWDVDRISGVARGAGWDCVVADCACAVAGWAGPWALALNKKRIDKTEKRIDLITGYLDRKISEVR